MQLIIAVAALEDFTPTLCQGSNGSYYPDFNRRSDNERWAYCVTRMTKSVADFTAARQELQRLFVENTRKQKSWDREGQFFFNMLCEPCNLDEAIADYWRSLPAAFRALTVASPSLDQKEVRAAMASPLLSQDETLAADVACDDLMKRVAAIMKRVAFFSGSFFTAAA